MTLPEVSVVLGSYNRRAFLVLAIESIRKELENLAHEIIVVDGSSTDGSLEWLIQQKDILTIVQHNRGEWRGHPIRRRSWGYFMNLAFKTSQGKYVCMLSDDCLVIPGAIWNGHQLFEEKLQQGEKIGAVAFYFRDWPIQDQYYLCRTPAEYLYVNHGLYLHQALKDVGYADEDTYQFYAADTDLCMKMRALGYDIIDSPNSFIEHYAHANLKSRASNVQSLVADNNNLAAKWKDAMIDPQTGNIRPSAMVGKDYVDTSKTARRFIFLHLKNYKLFAGIPYELIKITIKNFFYHPLQAGFQTQSPLELVNVIRQTRIYRYIRMLKMWRYFDTRINEILSMPVDDLQRRRAIELLDAIRHARLYRFIRLLGLWKGIDLQIISMIGL